MFIPILAYTNIYKNKIRIYENNIPKKLIPKEYGIQNLWGVELTNFWRMLYTIKGDEAEIIFSLFLWAGA